jgi:hypothetical protein
MVIKKLLKKLDRRGIDNRRQTIQRVAERIPLQLKGTAVFHTGGQSQTRDITTRDISAYGVYFFTDFRPNSSDSVVVNLSIEEDEGPFEATGSVVRVDQIAENNFGIAVKFNTAPNFA